MSENWSNISSPEAGDVAAVVVAAGSGKRMGGVRKQYLDLLGEPVLLRALRPFLEHPGISSVVVVLPEEEAAAPPPWLSGLEVLCVGGGAERSDSVLRGLRALPGAVSVVLVHDGARPLVTRGVLDGVIAAAAAGEGAVVAVPASDTIKEAGSDKRVVRTIPRSQIWQAQTPQGFPLDALLRCHERAQSAGWSVTDDAELFERCGLPVVLIEGDRENIKITRPEDLAIAEAIVRRRESRSDVSTRRDEANG